MSVSGMQEIVVRAEGWARDAGGLWVEDPALGAFALAGVYDVVRALRVEFAREAGAESMRRAGASIGGPYVA